MGLEKVKERVMEEAKKKAESRIDAAKKEGKRIAEATAKQAKEREKEFKEHLGEEIAFIKRREKAAAELEAKKMLLSFKKDFIESLFELSRKSLEKLPEAKRKAHVEKLLDKAAKEIDAAVVYCNKKDKKHVSKYTAKDAEIAGGIIAETADSSMRVDYSYETLLGQIKNELMPGLNSMLFDRKK